MEGGGLRRLRVSLSGRERVVKFPEEEAGNASMLVGLVIDAFELERSSEVQFVDGSGKVVLASQIGSLSRASDVCLYCHAKSQPPARVTTTAAQGLVQLLGNDDGEGDNEDGATAEIVRSLWPTLQLCGRQSAARQDGYQPVSGGEGVEKGKQAKWGDQGDQGDAGDQGLNSRSLRNRVEPASEFQGKAYQHQLVKFNRILAHLVNERTILAWLRANLALVTLSFKYMKLAAAFEDRMYASTMLVVCGGIFVTLLPVSWWSGYRRYAQCKQLLDSDVAQISVYLHKMGFDLDSTVYFLLMLSAFVTLCYSSTLIIWTSEGTLVNDDSISGTDIVSG